MRLSLQRPLLEQTGRQPLGQRLEGLAGDAGNLVCCDFTAVCRPTGRTGRRLAICKAMAGCSAAISPFQATSRSDQGPDIPKGRGCGLAAHWRSVVTAGVEGRVRVYEVHATRNSSPVTMSQFVPCPLSPLDSNVAVDSEVVSIIQKSGRLASYESKPPLTLSRSQSAPEETPPLPRFQAAPPFNSPISKTY